MHGYLIGQRVIVDDTQIAKIIPYPKQARIIERETTVWVRLINGIEQWRSINNVKPLPGGQM